MFAVIVKVQIKTQHREEFIEAMLADGRGSMQNEPGCLLFNIVEDHADPNLLHLYEVYASEQAFDLHKRSPHFQTWLEDTKDWLAAPLDIYTGNHLFPSDSVWKKQE
ncbi:MAG: antibiotic biosynthesis monooxygenase [Proteobacteria bacterium]|nr:antibiotic biosynthesis monooxygenase [Pseudomonadota bacterium]MBU1231697.1 antibiotic biosynthesis monooxygenase [Pseudomonadota bacterium]MBU1420538.1 antibiotic biosynthesis monooxygenase [Pseudomonadota bacterium]MBU1456101.1 antibiotic biosynthesis monooxygenase [Pseudomonadota bacterium]